MKISNKTILKIKALVFSAMIFLAACGSNTNTDTTANTNLQINGNIQIDGSSTVYPITEAMAEEFRIGFPDVKVTVGVSGTGGGFKKFGRGEIDICNASRLIKPAEDELCKENNISYVGLSVAYDGLTIVVNPSNTWVKDITTEELKKIWEPEAQGTIKRQNQVRPEWPNQEIHLYGAGVESGTYDYFTEAIVGKSHSSRGDYTASEDDNVLVQGVSTDKNALGFFGYAYYEENKDKLKAVPVDDLKDDNGKGPILPSFENIKDGSYAPLSRPLFIYVNSTAAARPEVIEFLNFYIDNAPELTKEVGYIPLTTEEYKKEKEKFEKFARTTAKL